MCVCSIGRGGPAGVQEPGRAVHGVRVARPGWLPPLPRRHRQHPRPHGPRAAPPSGIRGGGSKSLRWLLSGRAMHSVHN